MSFINPNFDPYLELQETKLEVIRHQNTIQQLIVGHNHNQELIRDLVQQHHQLVELVKHTRRQLDFLISEVSVLRGNNSQ